ncbi:MAG: hypothetical protein F6K11_02835 [Leptolyngbya sp. SIO3F4]|nr:hypothetical protein [Leptolyngbya sp. SIO3F4]
MANSPQKLFHWLVGSLLITLWGCQSTSPASEEISITQKIPTEPAASSLAPHNLPPPPPENSYLAQLPPEATNNLVSLAINIAIPTYLPQHMALDNYGIGKTDSGTPYYWLVYRDEQSHCFAIEYSAIGIDNISLENREPLKNALFGTGYHLYHGKFPNGDIGELPESDLFTDWLEGVDGFYRLIGAGLVNAQDYGQNGCTNIAIKEAIAVAESLSYLPTDIRTLELAPDNRNAENLQPD